MYQAGRSSKCFKIFYVGLETETITDGVYNEVVYAIGGEIHVLYRNGPVLNVNFFKHTFLDLLHYELEIKQFKLIGEFIDLQGAIPELSMRYLFFLIQSYDVAEVGLSYTASSSLSLEKSYLEILVKTYKDVCLVVYGDVLVPPFIEDCLTHFL